MGYDLDVCSSCCMDEIHCPSKQKCVTYVEYWLKEGNRIRKAVAQKTGHPEGCECMLCASTKI